MSAFVCHRDSLRCSLARSLARLQFEPAEPRDRPADLTRDSSSVFLSRAPGNSRASLSPFFLFFFFNVPRSIGPRAFIFPMIFVFGLSYTHLSLRFSLSRSPSLFLKGEKFLSVACLVRSPRSTARGLPPPRVGAENNRSDRLTFR